jgi:hypothetical protein
MASHETHVPHTWDSFHVETEMLNPPEYIFSGKQEILLRGGKQGRREEGGGRREEGGW